MDRRLRTAIESASVKMKVWARQMRRQASTTTETQNVFANKTTYQNPLHLHLLQLAKIQTAYQMSSKKHFAHKKKPSYEKTRKPSAWRSKQIRRSNWSTRRTKCKRILTPLSILQ